MQKDTLELSKQIETEILSIQQNIKAKNFSLINHQAQKLKNLILEYILNLDYEFKNSPTDPSYTDFLQTKEIINLNLQKISEYLKTGDERLLQEVSNSLNQIYNNLYLPKTTPISQRWTDDQERLFFNIFNQIQELSKKIYLYYQQKQIPKEEIKKIAQSLQNNIEILP